jgi:hypothetical protein
MADNLSEFMKKLEASEPPQFASPEMRYGANEDALTVYFRSGESYAYHLNNVVTLFLSFEGDELVGCRVKGLRRALQPEGKLTIAVHQDGKLELGLFFHLLAYDTPEPEPRNRLVELGQRAKGMELDTQRLTLSS